MSDSTATVIEEKAKAGYPAIYLQSSEYVRVLHEVKQVCEKTGRNLFIWTLSKGIFRDGTEKAFEETDGPGNALDFMSKTKNGIPELKERIPFNVQPPTT